MADLPVVDSKLRQVKEGAQMLHVLLVGLPQVILRLHIFRSLLQRDLKPPHSFSCVGYRCVAYQLFLCVSAVLRFSFVV